MRAVETLRQRISLPMGGGAAQGYTPVHPSDSEDADGDGSDYDLGTGDEEFGEGSRARGRGVGRVSAGGGRRGGREEDLLWPPYTPLYTNMKVLRRKRLDASMVYYRAGKCKCAEIRASPLVELLRERTGFLLAFCPVFCVVPFGLSSFLFLALSLRLCWSLLQYTWFFFSSTLFLKILDLAVSHRASDFFMWLMPGLESTKNCLTPKFPNTRTVIHPLGGT